MYSYSVEMFMLFVDDTSTMDDDVKEKNENDADVVMFCWCLWKDTTHPISHSLCTLL